MDFPVTKGRPERTATDGFLQETNPQPLQDRHTWCITSVCCVGRGGKPHAWTPCVPDESTSQTATLSDRNFICNRTPALPKSSQHHRSPHPASQGAQPVRQQAFYISTIQGWQNITMVFKSVSGSWLHNQQEKQSVDRSSRWPFSVIRALPRNLVTTISLPGVS